MKKSVLVGNGINIQFGGYTNYSGQAIMQRVINNIANGKYNPLVNYEISQDEMLGILEGLVDIINRVKRGQLTQYADGLFFIMEMERIKRTYPDNSTITSVFLEDYFLAAEIFTNMYKETDGEEKSEFYRKSIFDFLHYIIVDGIYNDGLINEIQKNYSRKMESFLKKYDNIFTVNYDYNLERFLADQKNIYHLHGEFDKLAPEYENADGLIDELRHVYSNAIMSWSWLDKYGGLTETPLAQDYNKFCSISGVLEIIGLAPANDEHLFIAINNNPSITHIVYYYYDENDISEIPHHIKKSVSFKKVQNLWGDLSDTEG